MDDIAGDTLTPNPPSKRTKRPIGATDDFKCPVPLNQPSVGDQNVDFQSPSCNAKVQKRSDPIKWDDYFMAIAFLSSMRSKDPSTQVGACIVNPDKRIVGMGYNGFPRGCSDDELPWCRQAENELDTKYPVRLPILLLSYSARTSNPHHRLQYVCHAEVNAILNKNSADVKGCSVCPSRCAMITTFKQQQMIHFCISGYALSPAISAKFIAWELFPSA